jgi:hypothetical protein
MPGRISRMVAALREPAPQTAYVQLVNLGALSVVSGTGATTSPYKKAAPKKQNTYGRPIFVFQPFGVIAAAGQNGHAYLEVAPATADGSTPGDAAFLKVSEVGCRNNLATGTGGTGFVGGTANIAPSATLCAPVPTGAWYRLTTEQITNYNEPSWVYVSAATVVLL